MLAVLSGFATGAGLAPVELAITIAKLGGFLVALVVGGLLIVPRSIRVIVRQGRPETLVNVSLVICFGMAMITEHVGYPVALGAFVAGLVIAESGHSHEVFDLVRPFRDVFAMMFFVSIGMQIDPAQLVEELPTIFVFTALVLVFKPLGVGFGSFAAGRGVQTSMRAGLSLAQNGELSFVIAGIGIASGVVRPSLLAIAVGVTCLTTLTSAVMIRGSEPLADWFAARLPGRFTTFVSFYESWLDRLRSRRDTAWHRVRRPVVVLAIDTAAVVVIVIGGSILGPRAIYSTGLSGFTANAIIAVAVIALSAPFGLGAVRRVVQIARMLALIVIPEGGEVDLGRAPRRALTLMLELAIAAVVTIPVVATIQPFTGTASLVVGGVVVFLIAITYRSIVDFTQHVHAGSELILELMKSAPEETATIGPQIETMLPGFGGLVSITLADTSSAVGKSLAELNLRARTGATVLAIGRGGGGFATPTPSEALAAGDVLALTGSDDALEAAKRTLGA
jgi:CPA2 family monovalent cation:H+ antiporter-2